MRNQSLVFRPFYFAFGAGAILTLGYQLQSNNFIQMSKIIKMDSLDPMQQKEEIFEQFVNDYQAKFFKMISKYEPNVSLCKYNKTELLKDAWVRNDKKGYGLSCIIQVIINHIPKNGEFFEKAGVNTTRLTIPLSAGLANQMKERAERSKLIESLEMNNLSKYVLYANGVSLVVHPINPFIPTVHANFRFLRVKDKETGQIIDEWFGGGCDLTPNYLFDEDATLYHQNIKAGIIKAAPENGSHLYDLYKDECDKYFVNKHRGESRGVGGVFFDDFHLNDSFEQGLNFARQIALGNLAAYETIIERRKDTVYSEENVRWRQYRRGRYVEFNLVYDRGTKFGLMTPEARIESILMSLPLIARWEYNFSVHPDSEEARLIKVLQTPKNWI